MKTFNFKKVTEPSYEPLPEDRYNVKVADITQGNTTAGDIMLNIKFNVINGLETAEQYKGRILWANMSLGKKAIGFFKLFLDATGSTLADSEEVSLPDLCDDLVGKTASCLAQKGTTPAGKPKNDLRYWKPSNLESSNNSGDDVSLVQ